VEFLGIEEGRCAQRHSAAGLGAGQREPTVAGEDGIVERLAETHLHATKADAPLDRADDTVIELDGVFVEDHRNPSFASTSGGGLPLQSAARAVEPPLR